MKEILINKVTSWTQQAADAFYNNQIRDATFGNFLWETSDIGTLLYSNYAATFFHNNGTIFKLSTIWCNNDWDLHCKLFNQVSVSKSCRIEIPLNCEFLQFNGKDWMYSEVRRPNNEYRISFYEDVLIDNVTTEYLMEWIDDATILMEELILLHSNTGCRFPSVFPKRIHDSNGVAWVDFKQWFYSYNQFISRNIASFYRIMLLMENHKNVQLDKKKLFNEVNTRWRRL